MAMKPDLLRKTFVILCALAPWWRPLVSPQGHEDTRLVPSGAVVEKVASDILFTDIPNNRIMVYNPASGRVGVFREPSGRANGLEFDAQGRLLACEGDSTDGGRRVSRTEKDGRVVALADSYDGKR